MKAKTPKRTQNQKRDRAGRFAANNGSHDSLPMFRRRRDALGSGYDTLTDRLSVALRSMRRLISDTVDKRRNINHECGYPDDITAEQYKEFYDREPVAARVVEVLPHESWQVQPEVFESEDPDEKTEFESAWEELDKGLRGKSWYQDAEGSPIWEQLRRVDVLSGIGSFGVVLLGLDDGKELKDPAEGLDDRGEQTTAPNDRKLLFMRSFDESAVRITQQEKDKTNPRFGQPTEYSVTFNPLESGDAVGVPDSFLGTVKVHWTRVIHVADNLGSSEVLGRPRQRSVFNQLLNIRKLHGGSAEMYWMGAFPGFSVESHPQLGPDVKMDTDEVRDALEKWSTGLQRWLAMPGVTLNSLAPQVVDPTPQINVQIDAICIQIPAPKRVFMGSERGELASSQDDSSWNDTLRGRQNNYLNPRLIVPFIDRLILLGVLPEPVGYSIVWPDLEALTEPEQAAIAVQRTEAMAKYVQGNVENLMTPMDYLTRVLSLTKKEAEAVIEAVMAVAEEDQLTMRGEDEIRAEVAGEFAEEEKEAQFKQGQAGGTL